MDARVMDSKEKLVADFRVVLSDAEELLKATASQSGEKLSGLRAKLEENVRSAKTRLASAEEAVVGKTKAAVQATDSYVHEHPWQTIGVAAAAGAVIGLLINRR
jgi:ElaB/YqjD/DUF883 family membrane-anchored ribosome-binding protein